MAKKKKPSKILNQLPNVMLVLGLLFSGIWMVHRQFYRQALSFDAKVVEKYDQMRAEETQASEPRKPLPTHIYSQWFIDVDIKPEAFENGQWGISADTASYLVQSARPGDGGNIIIYGHNTRKILGNIRAMKGGEKITLTTDDGVEHIYKVESWHEVEPTKVKFLDPTPEEILTIYTCSGFMDRKRFVVIAKPV